MKRFLALLCLLAAPASAQVITYPPLTLPVATAQGGTGAALTPAVGDIVAATSSTTFGRIADVATGSVLKSGGVTTAPAYGTINCAFLTDAGAGCTGGAAPSAANPTATIGTSAVNGSAATFMRSDAAPAFGNLTGPITSTGLATAIASQTGTGTKFVMDTGPTFATTTTFTGVATFNAADDHSQGLNIFTNKEINFASNSGCCARLAGYGTDGVLNMYNSARSGFTRLIFGNNSSTSFVALQTSGTALTVGLGDGTAGGSLNASGSLLNTGITTDATHTDSSVCQDTTTHQFYFGSGAAGICLGTSSARYKHDIAPLDVGLEQIMALEPVSYKLNADKACTTLPARHADMNQEAFLAADNKADYLAALPIVEPEKQDPNCNPDKALYGFIAEQGVKVLPELTGLDADGQPNTFDYLGVVPVLVRALQEQQAQINALKKAAGIQ